MVYVDNDPVVVSHAQALARATLHYWRPDSEVVVNYSDFLTVLTGVARKD